MLLIVVFIDFTFEYDGAGRKTDKCDDQFCKSLHHFLRTEVDDIDV